MVASRVLRLLGMAGDLLFVLCAYTPLPNLLSHRTEIPAPLEPAEAIVVLAGSVNAYGVLSESSLRRTLHGILLYRQGFAPRLVFSGPANKQGIVEADVRAAMARQLEIAPTVILTEIRVHTTREEAARLASLLQPMGVHTILLVTDPEHMVRAQPLFAHVEFTVHPAPVDELSQAEGSRSRLQLTREVVQEFLARLSYRLAICDGSKGTAHVFSIIIAGLTPASTLVTKSDEEPRCVGEDWTVGWDLPLDMLFTDSNMLRVEHLHLVPR